MLLILLIPQTSYNQLPGFTGQEDKSLFSIVLVKEGNPSVEELQELARNISDKWKDLGRKLNFEDDELTEFDEDHKKLRQKAYAMLMAWQRNGGKEATYEVLNEALCKVGRRDVAEKFCQ